MAHAASAATAALAPLAIVVAPATVSNAAATQAARGAPIARAQTATQTK